MGKKRKLAAGILGLALVCGVMCVSAAEKKSGTEEKQEVQKEQQIQTIYTEAYQEQVEERLELTKETNQYTEDAMLIEPNPFGTNTLSLYVYFQTEEPVAVSYEVSVKDEEIPDFAATPYGEESLGTDHEFQVIGIVPDTKNTITFTLTNAEGEQETREYQYRAGSLVGEEEVKLEQTVAAEDTKKISEGLYVILGNDSEEQDFMYYYDNAGIIRGEIPILGYRSHRLLFAEDRMYYSISETKIAAVNRLGKVEKILDTGIYKLHHDYVFDGDGNLLVLATDTESDSIEDQLIRINISTGEVSSVLDLGDLFADYKASCSENEEGELDWMHINTLQWLGEDTVILSSRETSSILKITDIFEEPKVEYMIGDLSFWAGSGYETLLLTKEESEGEFVNTGGQHTVTYSVDDKLSEGEYYLYMFNNNLGVSESRDDYDWSQRTGIQRSVKAEGNSYFYKYLVNEKNGTYTLTQSFAVPYSAYVSSAQEYKGNLVIDSGMQGIFGEYDENGTLLQQFQMKLADLYIYRVYKYDFQGFYFS